MAVRIPPAAQRTSTSRPAPAARPLPKAQPPTAKSAGWTAKTSLQPRDPPRSVPGSTLSNRQLSDLSSRFKSWAAMNTAVSVARGEQPGKLDPALAKLSKEQLAQADRYSHFANASKDLNPALASVAHPVAWGLATGYEYVAKNKTVGEVAARVTGDGQYKVDGTTSKSSYDNVKAGMAGWWAGIVYGDKKR